MLVKDLINTVTLSFHNPEFHSISQEIIQFEESRDGFYTPNQFFLLIKFLHYQQQDFMKEFTTCVKSMVRTPIEKPLAQIKDAYQMAFGINLLSGCHIKLYDLVDALTNDQRFENSLEMIELVGKFDEDWNGLLDYDEFINLIYYMREEFNRQKLVCAKMMKRIFETSKETIEEEDI